MRLAPALAVALALVAAASVGCDQACEGDEDCGAGFTCAVFSTDACERDCLLAPLRGEACSGPSDDDVCGDVALACADGGVCTVFDGIGTCGPASGRFINEVCDDDAQCGAGLVCATNASGGKCAPPDGRGGGAPCDDDGQCASQACDDGTCAP